MSTKTRSADTLSAPQAAREAGVTPDTVYAAVARGDLKASQPSGRNGRYRIKRADFEAWLDRPPAPTEPKHVEPVNWSQHTDACSEFNLGGCLVLCDDGTGYEAVAQCRIEAFLDAQSEPPGAALAVSLSRFTPYAYDYADGTSLVVLTSEAAWDESWPHPTEVESAPHGVLGTKVTSGGATYDFRVRFEREPKPLPAEFASAPSGR